MSDRRIIFECVVGSRLFGTARTDSDEDYMGVFLPSSDELLGLGNPPAEWSKSVKVTDGARNGVGDVDRKYYSIKRFLDLALQGQSNQLEMLFAPADKVLVTSDEWRVIVAHRHEFLSRESLKPFLGMALAQCHKSVIKADNLIKIRHAIEHLDRVLTDTPRVYNEITVGDLFGVSRQDQPCQVHYCVDGPNFDFGRSESGAPIISVAGRSYDINGRVKLFHDGLRTLEQKYGARTENAVKSGLDFKSLMHACRLICEAEELVTTGKITLPRPTEEIEQLLQVRSGEVTEDCLDQIHDRIEYLKNVLIPASPLPTHPNRQVAEELCRSVLFQHINGGWSA